MSDALAPTAVVTVGTQRGGVATTALRTTVLRTTVPAVVTLLAVAGCSVQDVDVGEQHVTAQVTSSSDATAEVRLVDPGTGELVAGEASGVRQAPGVRQVPGGEDTTVADGFGLPPVLDRAGLQELVTQHGTCRGGELLVAIAGEGVEVADDCGTLTVAGAGASVVAGHVDHLVVQASGAHVVVASVDRVTIQAGGVRVAWEDGTPRVDSVGADVRHGPVGVVRLGTAG